MPLDESEMRVPFLNDVKTRIYSNAQAGLLSQMDMVQLAPQRDVLSRRPHRKVGSH